MRPGIDPRVVPPVSRLRDDLLKVADRELVGVYVHGSAVLGDFIAGASDLDVLIVTRDSIERDSIAALAETLAACDPSPAVGVEASVVTRSAAMLPRAPWPFLVHVTNHPDDSKVVYGVDCDGDPDLVLHYSVLRQRGWTAAGTPAADIVGEIDRATIVARLAAELKWAAGNASESYAVLNACRALRFVSDGTVCSKSEGGSWALRGQIEPDLVEAALAARRGGPARPASAAGRAWVLSIASGLEQAEQ
jgi:hypothetical protein